jgi:hypothetical protein
MAIVYSLLHREIHVSDTSYDVHEYLVGIFTKKEKALEEASRFLKVGWSDNHIHLIMLIPAELNKKLRDPSVAHYSFRSLKEHRELLEARERYL